MINSEKENKKSGCRRSPLGDSLQPPCIFSYRIIPLLCLVYVVVYNESLCDGYYASQYHKSDNHHNLFSFPYINVVFSYLCPSFHLASCLATAYFMKFTLLLTSTASTTAKQQAATTNTIIIIVTLSFLSILSLFYLSYHLKPLLELFLWLHCKGSTFCVRTQTKEQLF